MNPFYELQIKNYLKMINIAEIIKKSPKRSLLYSPLFGFVEFNYISEEDDKIWCIAHNFNIISFNKYGQYQIGKTSWSNECMLFPSKDVKDWNNFNIFLNNVTIKEKCQFKPFDKVLVRDKDSEIWHIDLFEQYVADEKCPYRCMTTSWKQCIPCNEETEKLIDTSNDYITNAN